MACLILAPSPGDAAIDPQHVSLRAHQPWEKGLVQDHASVTSPGWVVVVVDIESIGSQPLPQ